MGYLKSNSCLPYFEIVKKKRINKNLQSTSFLESSLIDQRTPVTLCICKMWNVINEYDLNVQTKRFSFILSMMEIILALLWTWEVWRTEYRLAEDSSQWKSLLILPKFLCYSNYAIKRTYDTITFNFFICIYHIYVQLKSGTSSSTIWHHQPINKQTNK